MKKGVLVVVLWVVCTGLGIASEEGGAIFKSQGCMACHRPQASSPVNPSLVEIAQAYQGQSDRLAEYLKGLADPIVRPDKAHLMRRYLEKTRMLSDEARKAMAEFILGHQE
jgi:cytochrome c